MKLYRIRNWDKLYENNRTRELKKLDWVPFPNKQDGDGYTMLMEQENGPAIFGAWVACVQIASRCDPRGTLLRDGGKPHDSTSLSRMSRVPESVLSEMLSFLSSSDLNWLECKDFETSTENPAPSTALGCDIPASGCLEGKGREGKEEKEGNVSAPAPEIAEGAVEIPDEKTAIELAGMRSIPADFAKLCFGDWMDNNGCNSKNIPKPWQSYVSTRWRYEQEEWRSGKHRGKQSSQVPKVGPKQSEVIAYAKEKGDTYGTYAVSWFSYWNDPKRNWKKNGVTIDWKNEFQNSYASHRQKEAA